MKTVIRSTDEFVEVIELVKQIVSNLPDDKLKNNYSFNNLGIDEWVAISIYEGGFSSVSWRPQWGNNCRILNRFYKMPNYRFENNNRIISEETLNMIQQQIDVAKIMDFDCAFMSRETKTQAFNHYKKYLPQVWNVSNEKYVMTNKSSQYIMWTPINANELIMEKENVRY